MSEKRRPSSTSGSGDIRCPFFVAHNDNEIVCEGLIDGCRTCLRFKRTDAKRFHQETFCENQYKRCELYCSVRHWQWPED